MVSRKGCLLARSMVYPRTIGRNSKRLVRTLLGRKRESRNKR
ncbi:hypothetical protein OROGR_013682 [Orobanche gracilis]